MDGCVHKIGCSQIGGTVSFRISRSVADVSSGQGKYLHVIDFTRSILCCFKIGYFEIVVIVTITLK